MNAIKIWILAIRLKTLPASISPILLGSALAYFDEKFRLLVFFLAMLCAIFLQISVNLANDLYDGKSGVDTGERLGPKRVMQSGLVSEQQLIVALSFALATALVCGGLLMYFTTWNLLWFGFASAVAVFAYSGGPWPLASHAMGEITVFLFFGLLAVAGTYYAHTLLLTIWVFVFGAVAGLIAAAIMLVNNIRDTCSDAAAAKITLAVKIGETKARVLYVVMLLAAFSIHATTILRFGWKSLAPIVVCAPLAIALAYKIFIRRDRSLNTQLSQTALLEFLYCASMALVLAAFM